MADAKVQFVDIEIWMAPPPIRTNNNDNVKSLCDGVEMTTLTEHGTPPSSVRCLSTVVDIPEDEDPRTPKPKTNISNRDETKNIGNYKSQTSEGAPFTLTTMERGKGRGRERRLNAFEVGTSNDNSNSSLFLSLARKLPTSVGGSPLVNSVSVSTVDIAQVKIVTGQNGDEPKADYVSNGKTRDCDDDDHRTDKTPPPYKYKFHVQESCGVIYSVAFNPFNRRFVDNKLLFATAGSNRVSVYECLSFGTIQRVLCFEDTDKDENYFSCAWSYDHMNNTPVIAAAGKKGCVRILSTVTGSCVNSLLGHTGAINELLFHPKHPNVLLTASKDHSLRLWNIKSCVCMVIFGGDEGHLGEIITADFDLRGWKIVSGGSDKSIMVWKLDHPKIQLKLLIAEAFCSHENSSFETMRQLYPSYKTQAVHGNYVESTKWMKNLIFSKSCENDLVCWKAGGADEPWDNINSTCDEITKISNVKLDGCEGTWFIKLSMDAFKKNMALGCKDGKVLWFNLAVDDPDNIKGVDLKQSNCTSTVRHTAFSRDGKVLVCVCDDGTIWRWDRE